MARVKFGAIVTDMRGKLGGHLFQASGNTRVLRTGRKPTVVKTKFTQVQEGYLKRARNSWNTDTTAAKKQNWYTAAPNYPVKNAFGDKVIIGGRALFIKRYMAALQAGFNSPPDPTDVESYIPAPGLLSHSINTGAGTVTLQLASFVFEYKYALWAWKANNAFEKVSFKNFRLWYNADSTLSSDSAAYTALVDTVGSISVGDIVFVAVVATRLNGFKNSPIIRKFSIS